VDSLVGEVEQMK